MTGVTTGAVAVVRTGRGEQDATALGRGGADAAQPTRGRARRWAALVVLMLPVLLVSVDNTVLGFALPQISAALAPTAAGQLWIIDAYPLVLAGLLVAMGGIGDRFGRRRHVRTDAEQKGQPDPSRPPAPGFTLRHPNRHHY